MTGIRVFSVVAILFAVLFYVALRKHKRRTQELGVELRETYGDSLIAMDLRAVYYGLASRGALQAHEYSVIVALTQDRVRVVSAQPSAGVDVDLEIPLTRVLGYEMSHTFVYPGVRYGGDGLLLLRFTDEAGAEDVIALDLRDTREQVTTALEEHATLASP